MKTKIKSYEKPISLHPLSLEEAIKKAMKAAPPKKAKRPVASLHKKKA